MRQHLAVMSVGLVVGLVVGLAASADGQWLNHPTPGLPRTADGKVDLAAAAPRLPNGTPDLSGVWAVECGIYGGPCFLSSLFFDLAKDLKPGDVVMTPWAASIQARREARDHVDDPYGYCMPPGTPRINYGGGAFKILQTPRVTAFLYETLSGLTFRQAFTDGRPLPSAAEPTWLGYSIGRWESDTFVVETSGLRDAGWLDTRKARPHSDALRVTERLRRRDLGHIDLTMTIDDPKAFTKPFTVATTLTLLPDTDLLESFCDNHDKTLEHRRVEAAPAEPPSGPASSSTAASGNGVDWLTYPTPGTPRLADGRPDLRAAVPRTADGRPDLSGIWTAECPFTSPCWQQSHFFDLAKDVPAADVVMTPWAAAIQAQREQRDHVDDPLGYCMPPGTPRIMFYRPFKMLSTPSLTAFLHETENGSTFRQAFSDGRPLPRVTEPAWLGYSIGRWDGDVFVVETTGFRDGGWLDTRKGRPHSDALRVTERFRRLDFGRMALSVTIDDAKAFAKPWTLETTLTLLADTELLEGFCENHAKTMEHRRIAPLPPLTPSR